MTIVTSFEALLQPFAAAMTVPTYHNLTLLLVGWLFAPRRTVTGMLCAAGLAGRRHHAAFHRLFADARWCPDAVGLGLFDLIAPLCGATVLLAIDDTLCRPSLSGEGGGRKMFGAGMHHDPLASGRKKAVMGYGHSRVVLGILVAFPPVFSAKEAPGRVFCLPILSRLYLNKTGAAKHRRAYCSRPELAAELLNILCQHAPTRQFHAVAAPFPPNNSAYGGKSVLAVLPANCGLTSRLPLDARLHAAPPPRVAGARGRPRRRGEPLESPQAMLLRRARRVTLDLYGRRDPVSWRKGVRLVAGKARWYSVPDRELTVVAVEALRGGRGRQAFYSTDPDAAPEAVLQQYASRWSIEVAFKESKGHLGYGQSQGWTPKAAVRTAPAALWLYGLVVIWYHQSGTADAPPVRPWYRNRTGPSFADMLAALKRQTLDAHCTFFDTPKGTK